MLVYQKCGISPIAGWVVSWKILLKMDDNWWYLYFFGNDMFFDSVIGLKKGVPPGDLSSSLPHSQFDWLVVWNSLGPNP